MADRGNIIQRIIRLVFDRAAAAKADQDAKKAVSGVDRALGVLKKGALAAGGALAAAFAFRKIIQGVKDLTRESLESERVWKRLEGTLRTVGVEYKAVEGGILASARAMQDATTVGDEEFAETLQELVVVSQDFEGSLKNVNVVADVAAGLQIDLATAARLVGRAMVGETSTLKRYGIIVQEGADAVEQMRRQFAGLAENEAQSFGGRMDQLRNETGDLKEALGDFITQGKVGAGVIEFLTQRIKEAAEAITRLRETDAETAKRTAATAVQKATPEQLISERKRLETEQEALVQRWARIVTAGQSAGLDIVQNRLGVVSAQLKEVEAEIARRQQLPGVSVSAEDAVKFAEEMEKAAAAEVRHLAQLAELGLLTAKERARVLQLERQLSAEIKAGIPDQERRLEIAERLVTVWGTIARMRPADPFAGPTPALATPSMPGGQFGTVRFTKREEKEIQKRRDAERWAAEEFLADLDRMEQRAQMVAGIMTDAFSNFFETLITDSQNAGGALVAALLEGLARYLEIRATAAFMEALLGNPAANAAGIGFAAAAGAARALEAQLGGRRRSSGGGASSLSTGGGSRGSARETTPMGPEITLVLQGDFDALNPKFVRAVYSAQNEGIQTIGTGNVRIRTISRGSA
jgi:hypothetical protein